MVSNRTFSALAFLSSLLAVAYFGIVLLARASAVNDRPNEREERPPEPPDPARNSAKLGSHARSAGEGSPDVVVASDYLLIEEVDAAGAAPMPEHQRADLARFRFPPMRFEWNGAAESLRPAFEKEADLPPAALVNYSTALGLRLPNGGFLLIHDAVANRLRAWVELAGVGSGSGPSTPIRLQSTRETLELTLPAWGNAPARNVRVGL